MWDEKKKMRWSFLPPLKFLNIFRNVYLHLVSLSDLLSMLSEWDTSGQKWSALSALVALPYYHIVTMSHCHTATLSHYQHYHTITRSSYDGIPPLTAHHAVHAVHSVHSVYLVFSIQCCLRWCGAGAHVLRVGCSSHLRHVLFLLILIRDVMRSSNYALAGSVFFNVKTSD